MRRCSFRSFIYVVDAILLAGAISVPCRAQTPGVYLIDLPASHVEIHVFRSGFLSGLGDNHVIVLNKFGGSATQLNAKPWEVKVVGESASLEVKDPKATASTREEVQRTMLGPTQLDVKKYPNIEVLSTSLQPGATEKSWRMMADVTLHGVTRQVEFPLIWSQDGDLLRVHGTTKLRLRDFKIEPIRKAMGAIQVRNDFELIYDMVLRRGQRIR